MQLKFFNEESLPLFSKMNKIRSGDYSQMTSNTPGQIIKERSKTRPTSSTVRKGQKTSSCYKPAEDSKTHTPVFTSLSKHADSYNYETTRNYTSPGASSTTPGATPQVTAGAGSRMNVNEYLRFY